MADKLETFDFTSRGRQPLLKYESLFDGSIWRLTEHEDFPGRRPVNVASSIRQAAKKLGYEVETEIGPDTVVLRATPAPLRAVEDAE